MSESLDNKISRLYRELKTAVNGQKTYLKAKKFVNMQSEREQFYESRSKTRRSRSRSPKKDIIQEKRNPDHEPDHEVQKDIKNKAKVLFLPMLFLTYQI